MNDHTKALIQNSFGFNPTESQHHFLVNIPNAGGEPVGISEHTSWDDEVGSSEITISDRLDGQLRVSLARSKWDAIADDVRATFNLRLKKVGSRSGSWRMGVNLLRRELGKELVLLAWALEDADPSLIPTALTNWKGLVPEERWWLYTQAAAITGHALEGRNIGWRKAIRFALTENPTTQARRMPDYYRRAVQASQIKEVIEDDSRSQMGLFTGAELENEKE